MRKDIILVTGALGQIGSVLVQALRAAHGASQVIATDLRATDSALDGPFEQLDILDAQRLHDLVKKYHVTQIYHLAAILSAAGEGKPRRTWQVNMDGLFNSLEVAREAQIDKIFFPSSIAVFSHLTPSRQTPQYTVLHPTTVYGISKAAGEDWIQYYHQRYGMDIRSLRYPGIISHQSDPGGGTTDYAVDIFHYAVRDINYKCFLKADTALPMLYMPDAIRATLQLMEAPTEQIRVRTSYNLHGMTFTPAEIYAEIKRHFPNFRIDYQPDFRQDIAETWPASIDDSYARRDWNWSPAYNLESMTQDMIINLKKKYLTLSES